MRLLKRRTRHGFNGDEGWEVVRQLDEDDVDEEDADEEEEVVAVVDTEHLANLFIHAWLTGYDQDLPNYPVGEWVESILDRDEG